MKVLDARVNWNIGWNNDPELEILVGKIPDSADLRYEAKGGIYFAELEGYVSFFYHSGEPEQQEGYGGRSFALTMKDGSTVVLKGPWSSRSACANAVGFTPSVEVSIFTSSESWLRGFTAFAGHITEELYLSTVERFFTGTVKVEKGVRCGEPRLLLRYTEDPCEVCKGFCIVRGEQCRWCGGTGHEKDHTEVVRVHQEQRATHGC
jgi:hypothetical protein